MHVDPPLDSARRRNLSPDSWFLAVFILVQPSRKNHDSFKILEDIDGAGAHPWPRAHCPHFLAAPALRQDASGGGCSGASDRPRAPEAGTSALDACKLEHSVGGVGVRALPKQRRPAQQQRGEHSRPAFQLLAGCFSSSGCGLLSREGRALSQPLLL